MADLTLAPPTLTEAQAQEGFHLFLKSALAQAHAERLLDDETLSSAEGDLMVQGPALCLFFAALKSSTHPPSVIFPASLADPNGPPVILDITTCPPSFLGLFRMWSSTVQQIQSLPSDYQHDLARLICDQEPLSSPVREQLPRLAGQLHAVAIEISQRRTFQERYGSDLQAVLDVSDTARSRRDKLHATFVPPPSYDEAPREKIPPLVPSQPSSSNPSDRRSLQVPGTPPMPTSPSQRSSHHLSPAASSSGASADHSPPRSPRRISRSPTPSILSDDSPTIDLIRETLYAALADVLAATPGLPALLKSDPPLAYFASVALAILSVSLTRLAPDGSVLAVLSQTISEADVPAEYKPFMRELRRIGARARRMGEEDDERAMRYAQLGRPDKEARLDRLRRQIEKGCGGEMGGEGGGEDGRRTPQGSVTALANRINGLALGMTRLKAFRERQEEVFKVLAGVGK